MDFVRPVEAVVPGAQGRVLGVLARTTAELNLRTLARLADVSVAQASRVMPGLVELGLVERREVPPSSQFRLVREHLASRAILALSDARTSALCEIGAAASRISPEPVTVVVFGSLARGEAHSASDIDLLVVRSSDVGEDDERWSDSVEAWRQQVRTITGNDVEVVEASAAEAATKLRGRSELWRNIGREGVVVHGAALDALAELADA